MPLARTLLRLQGTCHLQDTGMRRARKPVPTTHLQIPIPTETLDWRCAHGQPRGLTLPESMHTCRIIEPSATSKRAASYGVCAKPHLSQAAALARPEACIAHTLSSRGLQGGSCGRRHRERNSPSTCWSPVRSMLTSSVQQWARHVDQRLLALIVHLLWAVSITPYVEKRHSYRCWSVQKTGQYQTKAITIALLGVPLILGLYSGYIGVCIYIYTYIYIWTHPPHDPPTPWKHCK